MGRRALFWSGAVLVGLIVQQAAVIFFGAGGVEVALGHGRPAKYVPQRTFLSLLNTADGKALLRWHGLVSHSRFAWRLKAVSYTHLRAHET